MMMRSQRSGFSLLEVLVATAVLTISLAIMLQASYVGRRHIEDADALAQAQVLCQTVVSEMVVGSQPVEPVPGEVLKAPKGWALWVEVAPTEVDRLLAVRVSVVKLPPGVVGTAVGQGALADGATGYDVTGLDGSDPLGAAGPLGGVLDDPTVGAGGLDGMSGDPFAMGSGGASAPSRAGEASTGRLIGSERPPSQGKRYVVARWIRVDQAPSGRGQDAEDPAADDFFGPGSGLDPFGAPERGVGEGALYSDERGGGRWMPEPIPGGGEDEGFSDDAGVPALDQF